MFRIVLISLLGLAAPAQAEVPSNLAQAEVVTGWREGETHIAGLTIRMAKGWHTYWRSPGAVGVPPSFNWSGSQNLRAVNVHFPVPQVYEEGGSQSLVYFDRVTLPLIFQPKDATQPIRLRGEIDIGVCEEICVPVTLSVSATLDTGGARDDALMAALKNKPAQGGNLTCEITPISDGLRMTAATQMPDMPDNAMAVIETNDPRVWVSTPELARSDGLLHATVDLVPPNAKPFALARSDVRMTVFADGGAIEMLGCS